MMSVRVVVRSNGSDASLVAVAAAALEAVRRGMSLQIVCCWDCSASEYAQDAVWSHSPERVAAADAENVVNEAAKDVEDAHPGLVVWTRACRGDPVSVLVDVAQDAGLLVIGARRRSRVAGLVFGSTSDEISRLARCPVLIVS